MPPCSTIKPTIYLLPHSAELTFIAPAGVDWVQEHVLGQGDQSNESAVEQAKDEQISDFIRGKTGIPVKDKERF